MKSPLPPDCLCFNLRKAARAVSRTYDQALAPLGLKTTQFSLLANLEMRGPTSVTALADAMVMERTTLTRNLRPLERDGWVSLAAGEDRRQRVVSLTAEGRRLYRRALPRWRDAQTALTDELGASRVERTLRDLRAAASTAR